MTKNTAVQTAAANADAPSYSGYDCGAEEMLGNNRIYVSLRTGRICQTDRNPLPGFKPAQTTNKDGSINNFYAKEYGRIVGFVTDLRWRQHTLRNGTVLSGWNVTIDTTQDVFVLQIGMNDRPFERFMNVALGVDFDRPVMFVGFMGKNQKTNNAQKVLLLSQEQDSATGKPRWLQPVNEERWLPRELIERCKAAQKKGIAPELTDNERDHLSWNKDGSINWNYPYISQGIDGKWSLDAWRNHLMEQVEEFVIPNIKAANLARGPIEHSRNAGDIAIDGRELTPEDDPATEYTGPPPAYGADGDIPF